MSRIASPIDSLVSPQLAVAGLFTQLEALTNFCRAYEAAPSDLNARYVAEAALSLTGAPTARRGQ